MEDMAISKELKEKLQANQKALFEAIQIHQEVLEKCRGNPNNIEARLELVRRQEEIVAIGVRQSQALARLRNEYSDYQTTTKTNAIKNGVEDKRQNVSNALNRARKQNIITRTTSGTSVSASDDSQSSSAPSTPEPLVNPLNPHDVSQSEFLAYFGLATHDLFKELQNKRAERKRRSTANPQFLYQRGWDFSNKRGRRGAAAQNASPPHTRQAGRNKKEKTPPKKAPSPPPPLPANILAPLPAIPNLPSGLTIERVTPAKLNSVPNEKICVECRLPGTLLICELCTNGFHLSCHNRPLAQTPRQCPRCMSGKETRTVGLLNVPSAMSVSYVPTEIPAKTEERDSLLERNKSLNDELVRLQDRHSQLTISLKTQQVEREELLVTQQSTEEKIQKILKFITSVKSDLPPEGNP